MSASEVTTALDDDDATSELATRRRVLAQSIPIAALGAVPLAVIMIAKDPREALAWLGFAIYIIVIIAAWGMISATVGAVAAYYTTCRPRWAQRSLRRWPAVLVYSFVCLATTGTTGLMVVGPALFGPGGLLACVPAATAAAWVAFRLLSRRGVRRERREIDTSIDGHA